MEEAQSFRSIGTVEIEKIPIQHLDGQNIIYWEDIDQIFPGVKYIKNDGIVVTMARDSNGAR